MYRTQVKIVADVLASARDGTSEGVNVSTLLRKGNLSYSRLTKMLKQLVSNGLLTEVAQEQISKYRISEDGLKFLEAYSAFEEFATTFGIRL